MKLQAQNEQAWLQGLYIYNGVAALFSTDKKKKLTYPKKPFDIFEPDEEEKNRRAEAEREKAIRQLNAFKDAWDKKYGR